MRLADDEAESALGERLLNIYRVSGGIIMINKIYEKYFKQERRRYFKFLNMKLIFINFKHTDSSVRSSGGLGIFSVLLRNSICVSGNFVFMNFLIKLHSKAAPRTIFILIPSPHKKRNPISVISTF